MKTTKYRFFHDTLNDTYFVEKIDWALAGSNGISLNDPRIVPIGQTENGIDLWLPIAICNCGSTMMGIEHQYNTEPQIYFDENRVASEIQQKTNVLAYSQMDVYAQPLKPNLIEITMTEYNNGVSST